MTPRTAGIILIVTVACALSSAAAQQSTPPAPAQSITASHQATLKQYCTTCHNARVRTGGLAIDELDVTNVNRDKDA